jgi:acyl-coenzyme A synthetase/AMP-(fatty) acid ligase
MLYEHWQSIATENADRTAIFDPHGGRDWTFAELADAAANTPPGDQRVRFVSGHDARFFVEVLAGWRNSVPVFPLERNQSQPSLPDLEADVAHLKQTSGTTGEPRLIAFTAQQIAADAGNIVSTMGLEQSIPNLAAISLAHSYGFSNIVTPLLLHGIPVILSPTPLPEAVKRSARGHQQIALPAVPAMWRAWHSAGSIPANVRIAISAGAPLPLELEQTVFHEHDLKIHNFCGSSECGGIAYDRTDSPRVDASLIGEAMNHVTLSIDDTGCLVVESDAVAKGYLPKDEQRLSEGRFVTSDLAELVDGQLRITGRASDVINVAGRKLSPETVENTARAIDGITNCVAFGIPSKDDVRCEEVAIVVELQNDADTDAIKRRVSSQLDAWQVPRHWWVVDEIGVTARGKVSRPEWRARFLQHSVSRQHD